MDGGDDNTYTSMEGLRVLKTFFMRCLSFLVEKSEQKCLSTLIEDQRWRKLNNAIVNHLKKNTKVLCTCKKCTSQQSFLHLACNFSPPLYVVHKLFEFDTFNASQMDLKGRYPLHLALENESTVGVVEFLIESNQVAVKAQDVDGKTSLHMVLQQYAEKMEKNKTFYPDLGDIRSLIDSLETRELLSLLCNAIPSSLFMEDNNGMTALDYAIHVGADYNVVNLLEEEMQIAHTFQMEENRSQPPPLFIAMACAA